MEPNKNSSSSDGSVRITGVKRDGHDHIALRKIARACIAIAKDQLDQERRQKKPKKYRSSKEADNA